MRKSVLIILGYFIVTLSFFSCGKATKKGIDYVEKNSGKIEKFFKGRKPNPNRVKSIFENQSRIVPCARCSQQGFLYRVDNYGNILTDYNGNAIIVTCPNCGGRGQVTVSE